MELPNHESPIKQTALMSIRAGTAMPGSSSNGNAPPSASNAQLACRSYRLALRCRRFHVGTVINNPLQMPDTRRQASPKRPPRSVSFLGVVLSIAKCFLVEAQALHPFPEATTQAQSSDLPKPCTHTQRSQARRRLPVLVHGRNLSPIDFQTSLQVSLGQLKSNHKAHRRSWDDLLRVIRTTGYLRMAHC